jgi:hypothetical protein
MDIKLTMDSSQLDKWTTLATRKLKQAVPYRINMTVERVIKQEFGHIRGVFHIRGAVNAAFFFGTPEKPGGAAGKFPRASRATVDRPYAEFGISLMEQRRPGGKGGPILLAGFETGEMRTPHTPYAKSIAVPALGGPARPTISSQVPPAFRIANLKLQAYYGGAKIVRPARRGGHRRGLGIFANYGYQNLSGVQGLQWKGLQRTFLLPHTKRAPLGAIFQRTGRGRDAIRNIYPFIAPYRLDTRLRYVEIAQAIAPAIFRKQMELAFEDALRYEVGKSLMSSGL